MKRKMARKQKEALEEEKEIMLPPPPIGDNNPSEVEMQSVESKEVLLMRVVTWLRDSHALFDYESRQIQKKNLKIESPGKFVRTKDEVKYFPLNEGIEEIEENKLLFNLKKDEEGNYFIETEKEKTADKLWLVVRAMKTDKEKISYELKKDDIIKLGRIQFRVKDLQTDTITKNDPNNIIMNEDIREVRSLISANDASTVAVDGSIPQCRFGWVSDGSEENPLISACKGEGTMKYIHLNGLKHWVKSKVKPISNEKLKDSLESYVWKTFEGEICITKYPYTLKYKETYYSIFDVDVPEGPFCILESLSIDKNSSRMIFIMKPNKDQVEFRIGRGHDSDIRVSDISVSRFHAKLKYEGGKFLLDDNTSKFGTLVMIKDKTPIVMNYTCAVQSGRTVVTYMLRSFPNYKHNHSQGKFHTITTVSSQHLSNKLNDYKKEEENLFNTAGNKPNEPQIERVQLLENIGSILARNGPRQNEIPLVSENILRQEMEEEKDSHSQQDPE